MPRWTQLWLAVAAISASCAGASSLDLLIRDARIVHDVAEMRFDAGNPAAPWVLLNITPNAGSGGSTILGAVMDGTGKNSQASVSGQASIVETGSWKLLEALDRFDQPRQGAYTWAKPYQTHQHILSADDVYSPFTTGGDVICRLDVSLTSEAAFQPSFLIPPGWEGQALSAYRQFKENPVLWRSPQASARLATLVNSSNKFLSVQALRELAGRGQLTPETIRRGLSDARDYQLSAFIYALLTSRAGGIETTLRGELERLVRASAVRERHSIALGIFAARLFRPDLYSDRLTQSLASSLLESMHPPDSYLTRTLQGTGTP